LAVSAHSSKRNLFSLCLSLLHPTWDNWHCSLCFHPAW
jgi:hypothetical protein